MARHTLLSHIYLASAVNLEKSQNFHQQNHLDILNHYFTSASITIPLNTIVYIHMFRHASYK